MDKIFYKKGILSFVLLTIYVSIISAFAAHKTMFSSGRNVILFAIFNALFTYASVKLFDFKKDKTIDNIKTFIDKLPLTCYVTDENYNFIIGNDNAYDLFEIDEKTNKAKVLLNAFEKTSFETIQNENYSITHIKQPISVRKFVSFKDGRRIEFKVKKVPIFDKYNTVKGFIIFAQDITDVCSDIQNESYIPVLTRKIKAPLIAQIQALNSVLNKKNMVIPPEQRELLGLLLESDNNLLETLATVFSTYKYENNDVKLNFEKVCISELIQKALDENIIRIKSKNIDISFDQSDSNYCVEGDKEQLDKAIRKIILNSVLNAGLNTTLCCKMHKELNNLAIVLSFENPYKFKNKVIDVLNTDTNSKDKFDKIESNFDLYLAKRIIVAHGGKIALKNTNDNLITYNIELPQNIYNITERAYCEI